jgi:hypothetical protein
VVLRKNISRSKGEHALLDEIRYGYGSSKISMTVGACV